MLGSFKRFGATALVGLAALGTLAPDARAQRNNSPLYPPINPNFQIRPGLTINQAAYNVAVLGRSFSSIPPYILYNPYPRYVNTWPVVPPVAYNPYLSTTPYSNPYLTTGAYGGGYGGGYGTSSLSTYPGADYTSSAYTNPYYPYYDPAGSYLHGVADLTTSIAQYQSIIQKGRLTQQQVYQSMIETKHKMFEEDRYERMHKPSAQDLYEKDLADSLRRARRDPPPGEIYSARALNDLLRHLKEVQLREGDPVTLDPDTLKRINVKLPSGRGNLGLLKDIKEGGSLEWPLALKGSEYQEDRKQLERFAPAAVQQAQVGALVDTSMLRDMNAALKRMNETLVGRIEVDPPSDFIVARRYLVQLEDAVKALEDPQAAKYFQDWRAKGKTAAELVNYMKDKGLVFAPSTNGDEFAYQSLYQSLRAFDASIGETSKKGQ
jgi:hypothetical protein